MERLNHPYYKETSGLYKYDYQAEPKYEGYCMDDYIGAFIVWIILSVIILFIGIFTWFLEYISKNTGATLLAVPMTV